MIRRPIVVAAVYCLTACSGGGTPEQIGVKVNAIGLQKTDAGPTSPDLPGRFIDGESLMTADLMGSDEAETLRALDAGRGVEIVGSDGQLVARIQTTESLTHFGAIEASRPNKKDVVLYTYPNDERGGTFRVVTPDQVSVGTWKEFPPPSHFTEGEWGGKPALFYLQRDELVVRNRQQRLVFQEFAEEHAFGLMAVSEHAFQVLARSRQYLYKGL